MRGEPNNASQPERVYGVQHRAPEAQYNAMSAAARYFLKSLSPELRAKAVFPFQNDERLRWHFLPHLHYAPEFTFSRNGVSLGQMTKEQRVAAHALLQSGLSTSGYLKAAGIIRLEDTLRDVEVGQGRDPQIAARVRTPENYFFTIFGDPATSGPWGWRADGHHLSLNFTSINGGLTAATPAFMGTNPAIVLDGPHAGSSILSAEGTLARELLSGLDSKQRARAVIAATAPDEIITGNARKAILNGFAGIPALNMNDSQRRMLMLLIEEYVNNMRGEFASSQLRRIRSAGVEKIHFAWAGGSERGQPHYYRIHGPSLLIEFDNTQNNANHIHTVCRDLEYDFGGDMLRQHYEESKHR
ncbi:MAG: DUF3500 domain-containing protein [Acidobacteria bacterium]|nr:DUF3500 domain-containing protein [Acidobacteriota bacterium]